MNNYILVENIGDAPIQRAISLAKETGLDKVVVPKGEWKTATPILLPDGIHIVLDGAVIVSEGVAFRNERLYSTFGCMKEGRQQGIVITGENSAKIKGSIVLHNAENIKIENISFENGGVTLSFCHDARVRSITSDTTALYLMNGCHQIFANAVKGETALKAISRRASVSDVQNWNYDYNFDVFEESPEICFGVFEGICGKVTLFAEGEIYNIRGEAEASSENKEFFHIYNFVIER